jgi:dipeptidyl aminopeptidase/acylaminoacyl peptidase
MMTLRLFKQLVIIISIVAIVLIPESITLAQTKPEIAFVRNDDLWVQLAGKEKAITNGAYIRYPKWSHDGRYLAYLEGMNSDHLWVYDSETEKKQLIFQTGVNNYEWSPVDNQLAFQSGKVLNVANPAHLAGSKFHNVMLGVGNFSWQPDGKGFIVSSEASLLPTGWSEVALFKVPLDANMDPSKAQRFYTLPKNTTDFLAISTSSFKWSSDGKWLSFIAIPTASLSADSDTLCILSSDGKEFMAVDQMLMDQEWFQWAPTKNWLAYIEGTGRFAVQNKHLKIKKLPATGTPSYTPKGFADRGFTWAGDTEVIISRAKESEWDNNPARRPLPALYQIDVTTGNQKQITKPKQGYGDFNPIYKSNKLYWARSNRKTAQLMVANSNGTKARVAIKNMDAPPEYYENRDWQAILSIH